MNVFTASERGDLRNTKQTVIVVCDHAICDTRNMRNVICDIVQVEL